MYPSISMDFQKESSSPAPSAPPYPPPPPPPTPSPPPSLPPPPLHIHFEQPMTATGIPVNVANQTSTPVAPPDPSNLKSHSPFPWSTGLCDCCDDLSSCCLTCWCPCVTFGRIAEIVDRGSTSCAVSGALYTLILCLTGCSCLYSCFYRSKLRGQYFLEENPCTDCCIHCCCEECSLCQEYRELNNQGFDMSIGWHGNMERQKRLASFPPAVEGGMSR